MNRCYTYKYKTKINNQYNNLDFRVKYKNIKKLRFKENKQNKKKRAYKNLKS